MEQHLAYAMYERENRARRENGGALPPDYDSDAAAQQVLDQYTRQMQQSHSQQQLQMHQ